MNLGLPFAKMAIETYDDIRICTCTHVSPLFVLACCVAFVTLARIRTHTYMSVSLYCRFRINVTQCPFTPRCTAYANETWKRKRGKGGESTYIHIYTLHVHVFICACAFVFEDPPTDGCLG